MDWQPIENADDDVEYILGGWFDHVFVVDQCYKTKEGKWESQHYGVSPDYFKPWTEPRELLVPSKSTSRR